jgi:hypothetical protein
METRTGKPLNQRAFVALIATISGAGLPLTGLANHLLQTEPITLPRHAWMAAHDALGIIFTVFAVWHVILNRRALMKHAKGLAGRLPALSREAVLAVALVGILLFLAVGHTFIAR